MPVRDLAAPLREGRILVYGVTGSGKSTVAARLADATGLPLHLVDELTFLPHWVQVEPELQRRELTAIAATDAWVLDTAYGAWLDVVLPRCELVLGLDYPRWLSLGRLLRRTVTRLVDRRPICNGNVETLRMALSRDSIVVWHFRSFRRKRSRMHMWAAAADGPPVLLFRRPADLQRWLRTVGATTCSTPSGPSRRRRRPPGARR